MIRELTDVGACRLADGPRLEEHVQGKELAQARHDDVRRDIHAGRQSETLPVLGEIADAKPHRVLRRADRRRLASDDDLPAIERIGAEDRSRHFRAAGPHQACETEDFALPQLEADVLNGVASTEVADLKHHIMARQVGNIRLRLGQAAADHHRDDRVDARGGGRDRADIFAVAHDSDAVRDFLQLVHLVGDIDDADALGFELADDGEQLCDLRIVQGGRGLIHDQDPWT